MKPERRGGQVSFHNWLKRCHELLDESIEVERTSKLGADSNGIERADATRNKRREAQRNASEDQTRRHKQKWQQKKGCSKDGWVHKLV